MGLAQRSLPTQAPVPTDPRPSIARAYRFERARRTLRLEHRDERRRADRRFWGTVALLLLAIAVVVGVTVQQLESLFGL